MRSSFVLVVGAGFAGAVGARELADAGYKVHVTINFPTITVDTYDRV